MKQGCQWLPRATRLATPTWAASRWLRQAGVKRPAWQRPHGAPRLVKRRGNGTLRTGAAAPT